ncbi:MAG: sigma-70 family RNA polymerase sigma factor [Microcoleaceae cyanobacterium]
MENLPIADDALLLAKIANGDHGALSQLYDRYAKIIYAVAFRSLRSVEDSEEVVLDVFSQIWRIASRYDVKKGKAETWLFTLARSRILDRLRKLKRIHPENQVSIDAMLIQLEANSSDPVEEVWLSERRSRVLAAIQTLPKEQRLVIELAYYQGLTQSQIAAQTGLALGTVKTRIRLGLNKLKSALGSYD